MAPNIFINRSEGRLRAFWRLFLQALIFIAGTLVVNILTGIVIGIVIVTSGGNLQDPQAVIAMSNQPLVRGITSIGALLFMLLSYWVAARWLDRRPLKDFGFHFGPRWWSDFGFGLLLGAVLMVFIFGVELAAGWVTVTQTRQTMQGNPAFWGSMIGALVVFFCVGIYEEMLSRGYELRNLAEGLNFKFLNPRIALLLAYLISSSLFGLLHLGNPNASLISTVNLIVAGLFLGLGYVLTGELAISIGLHMTWNFFQGNVFGFPVSGTAAGASFIGIQQSGPEIWTGGAFGPEAGLIGLAAILLGSLLIVLWVRWQHGGARLQDRLAVYASPVKATPAAVIPVDEGLSPLNELNGN